MNAQETADNNDVEEVVVTGTQIKGARINEALPVTVITSEDIDDRGVNSGDELLATLIEQGNQFNDVGSNGGGVNALEVTLSLTSDHWVLEIHLYF